MRNLKRLGIAFVAVFAMSAVVASAAQAVNYTSTDGNYPTTVAGNQEGTHEFKAGIRTVTCSTAQFEGTATAASSTLTITPTYTNCLATGSLPVTVAMNGCDYLFHATSTTASTTDIVCPVGNKIVVNIYASAAAHGEGKAPVCKINIGGQTGLTGLATENQGSGTTASVKTTANIANIAVTIEGSALVCGTGATATYKGVTPISGSFGGNNEGVHIG